VLVAAVTAAAKLVTPTVVPTAVPTVVPTALMHQNTAIATAATALASSLRGAKMLFPIPLTLPFSPHICVFQAGGMRDLRVSAATDDRAAECIPCALSHAFSLGKDRRDPYLGSSSSPDQSARWHKRSIRTEACFAKDKMGSDARDSCELSQRCLKTIHAPQGQAASILAPSRRISPDSDSDHRGNVGSPLHDGIEESVIGTLGDQHVVHGQIVDAGGKEAFHRIGGGLYDGLAPYVE
jgi:hypothetical protein